jgi:anaerobic ribonucleoside-triphosphate reductase activating protein
MSKSEHEPGIYVLKIVEDTTVDGTGFRTSIYAAGCPHRCPGCHNPQSRDIANGSFMSIAEIMERIRSAEFSNVTFTGGDPLAQVSPFVELAREIRSTTNKTIWCYTGYLYETVVASGSLSRILPLIDVLVDGPYVESLRDESSPFVGSSNQRIIDVATGKTIRNS